MDLNGKRVLVFGAGISGIGSAGLLLAKGAVPVIYDGNAKLSPEDVLGRLPEGSRAEAVIGSLPDELLKTCDLAVLSPGVPCDLPDVNRIREAGIPIWGEIELAYVCGAGRVLAITGTNGKTTTTTLVGEILKWHQKQSGSDTIDQVFVVGNIGTPYTGAALSMTQKSVSAAEISSFQLETTVSFHPQVSAITNITPDHLNRHHTMEEYIRVKERITEAQTAEDTCVLNYEDEILREFGKNLHTKVIWFSSARILEEGFCIVNDEIVYRHNGSVIPFIRTKELHLPGLHNYENVMTAAAMTFAFGVPAEEIRHVLKVFTAVEHRIEYVAEKRHVVYYNDSKGTNPDAAIKAIQAMDRPTLLIGGGYDKNSDYEEWIRAFGEKVKKLVLIGQTREKIAQTAQRLGFTRYEFADSFEEAFRICVDSSEPGDAVLLSPACASWDMFPNYETRGKIFKSMVLALPDQTEE